MKKQNGFTLIELIIAMAIMAIIFGGIVYIFGAASSSAQMGMNQQQAYEDARTTMELLKTSLRYADKNSAQISTTTPTKDSTSFYYTSTQFDKHWDISNGTSNSYIITVKLQAGVNPDGSAWTDKTKKQLYIKAVNNLTDATKIVLYPRYAENSTFVGGDFPITVADNVYGSDVDLFKITLPVQYKHNGAYKQDSLISNVTPTDYSNTNISSEATTTPTYQSKAEILIKAVTAMYNDPTLQKQLKVTSGDKQFTNNISSGAFNQKGLSGITLNLKAYLRKNDAAGLATLGETAWVIAAIDVNGNMYPGVHPSSVAGWRVFIAKNVVNDVDSIFNNKDAAATYAEQAANGNLIIRPGYGLLAYTYDSDGQTGAIKGDVSLGYMTAILTSNSTLLMMDFNSWVPKYTSLIKYNTLNKVDSKKDLYVEDQYSGNTKATTGTYNRLDYNESGEEYTLPICNAKGIKYTYNARNATTPY
jgi:prepilin-type N-terminal cleavage/methylation domain-containing protein